MLQRSSFKGAAIFLLLALVIATVASVPTSVLVQNSEMASNSNGKNGNNNNNNNSNLSNLKVKRSSNSNNNMKESAASAAAALNKKSSPEIVPASYNSPPQTASFSSSSSPSMTNSARQGNAGVSSLPTNGDIINSAIAAGLTAAAIEAAAAASQRELEQQQQQQQYVADDYGSNNEDIESPTLLRKRGISSQQYLYGAGGGGAGVGGGAGGYGYGYAGNGDYYNNPVAAMAAVPASAAAAAGVPNGIWADEIDPQLVYSDLQEFDDYAPRAPYHNKAYDNLQNILNSETYLEPVALPLQYTGRYYGADADRKKRSNLNKLNKKYADMRLKRDTKLTPADMLALVALVEAGERARKDTDADTSYITYPDPYSSSSSSSGSNNYNYSPKNSYYPPTYDFQPNNNLDELSEYNGGSLGGMGSMSGMGAGGGAWLEPSVVDYYGVPYNMETLPKYELPPREHKYAANNRYSNKRFMVSKKKRSMGQFLNEPVAKPSFSYSSANGEKYF